MLSLKELVKSRVAVSRAMKPKKSIKSSLAFKKIMQVNQQEQIQLRVLFQVWKVNRKLQAKSDMIFFFKLITIILVNSLNEGLLICN